MIHVDALRVFHDQILGASARKLLNFMGNVGLFQFSVEIFQNLMRVLVQLVVELLFEILVEGRRMGEIGFYQFRHVENDDLILGFVNVIQHPVERAL